MIATDEEALVCDLAETYKIYDYKSLPATRIATYSVGLRENSRIKLKMSDSRYSLDSLFLAAIVDRLSLLVWLKTKDGAQGVNRPKSIMANLLGETEEKNILAFQSPGEFEKEWKKIIERGEEHE